MAAVLSCLLVIASCSAVCPCASRQGAIDFGTTRLTFFGQTREEKSFDVADPAFVTLLQSVRGLSATESKLDPLRLETDETGRATLDENLFPDHPGGRWALLN